MVEPAAPFIDAWHVGAICEHLQAVTRGEIARLVINVPPGHAKSLLVSVFWPAGVWIGKPDWRGIFSAYAGELALRDSLRCRALIESQWYRETFSDPAGWTLSGDQNVKSYFTNTKTGSRLALSVGGKATGFRGDAIVVDDPINATEAPSKLVREDAIFWWDKVMSTRLNDPRRGARVIIMHRLHEQDLSGHVLAQAGYEHLCLPSEYDLSRAAVTYHVVANGHGPERHQFFRDPRTEEGELLFPAVFPRAVLDQAKKDLGSAAFAAQHQQTPVPPEGLLFKREWLAKEWAELPNFESCIAYWDLKLSDSMDGSWVVGQVWGRAGGDVFLLDQERFRGGFVETIERIARLRERWPKASPVYVEQAAAGPAVIEVLKKRWPDVIGDLPKGSKIQRAEAIAPMFEAGSVRLPPRNVAPWIDEYREELSMFPRSRHDDQVDATSGALGVLRTKQREYPIALPILIECEDWTSMGGERTRITLGW